MDDIDRNLIISGLKPYEKEIILRFSTFGKMAHPSSRISGWKGIWIRGYLKENVSDYVYNMFKNWKRFCE